MAGYSDLPRAKRWKLLARALIRAVVTATILVVLYYVLPLSDVSGNSVLVLAVGLLGVVLIVAWQVRAIVHADFPLIQGIEALALTVPLFLLLFSTFYFEVAHAHPASFGQQLTRTDALYFTVTTFATVGYGDITAKSQGARVIVIIQMLTDLVVLGLGVRVLLEAVQLGRQRRTRGEPSAPSPATATATTTSASEASGPPT